MMPMASDETVPVVENRPLTQGHFLLSLQAPRQAEATRPGQFAMLRMLGRSDVLLRRPMSIYDVKPAPEAPVQPDAPSLASENGRRATESSPLEVIQVLYKIVGRGTRLMAELKPGDQVGLLAPLGHGFFEEDYLDAAKQVDEIVYVAGGIGIAALLMPAKELARCGCKQRLFFGGRTKHDLVGIQDFRPYVRAITLATEDGSRGRQGRVTLPFSEYLRRRSERRLLVLACGPWAMLQIAAELAARYGHRSMVSMENRMGCALGVCLGCSIRVDGSGHGAYERVCTEGPVFWSDHVVWNEARLPQI